MVSEPKVQQNNSKILDCLQEAVNAETTSRNFYWARSVFWRSMGLSALSAYYLNQSSEDHAQRSADRMAFLGRQPHVDPEAVASITDESIAAQLKMDLEVECVLADSYQEWIKVAEDSGDYITRNIWTTVLTSTQEHIDLLQGWLRQIDLVGEEDWLATWRTKNDRGM